MSLGLPNTVLNTIVAEAIDDLASAVAEKTGGRRLARGGGPRGRQGRLDRPQADRVRRRRLLGRVARRGRAARPGQPAPDAGRAAVARSSASTVKVFENYDVLSERELHARYEVFVEQYVDDDQHRGRDRRVDRAHDAAARPRCTWAATLGLAGRRRGRDAPQGRGGRPRRRVRGGDPRARGGQRRPPRDRGRRSSARSYVRDGHPGDGRVREVADKLEQIVPDDLWPLPKYSEILFIK